MLQHFKFSLQTALANNQWNVQCNFLQREVTCNVSHNKASHHMIHTFHTQTPHWWLHRETREMICVYRQQNVTSFSGNGLDGAVDPLDTPIFIKIISFSRPVSNGTSWMLRSQPEPQDSKIYETYTKLSSRLSTDVNKEIKHIYLTYVIKTFQPLRGK